MMNYYYFIPYKPIINKHYTGIPYDHYKDLMIFFSYINMVVTLKQHSKPEKVIQ